VADAKPGETRLIVSNGLRAPLEAVKTQAEKAIGHPLVTQYGASLGLKATIESGQPFELAIVTPEVLDDMIKQGKVLAGSRFDIARVPVAIGQRGDAPPCDFSTSVALKDTMVNAKSIRWATNGASLPTINHVLEKLGIGDEIRAKVNLPGQVALGPGEYELNINLASEILPLTNHAHLGNIPAELNIPAVMSAGIGASSDTDSQAAKALLKFLQGPAIEPALNANGMTR
jgi:molybdate transport system substrate-binding protein